MDMEKYPDQAFHHIKNAADQGDAQALHQLGILYKIGQGCEQSYENAFNCFRKVADQNANAMFNLGYFYYTGYYVRQDVEMAVECFTKAALGSDLEAFNALGKIYQRGCGTIKADPVKSYQLFLHAAQQGHHHALIHLGTAHLDGLGVKKDISLAIQYFKKSVDQNNVRALFQLIKIYKQNPDRMKTDPQAMDYGRMVNNAMRSLRQAADKK